MTVSRESGGNSRRLEHPINPTLLRRGGQGLGRTSPGVAVLLSLLSWPEPDAPRSLKPFLVLGAAVFWLVVLSLAARIGPLPGGWPILPTGLVLLICGFVGGSVIAILVSLIFSLLLYAGVVALNLPDFSRDMVDSGYKHRDLVMFVVMAWLTGVPHWKKRFSWVFTFIWGLAVVFGPVIFVLVSVYVFYGHLPAYMMEKLLNRELLLGWGVTVIVAAVAAKILYLIKDILRRVLS